jgi:hypothetical protein
LAKKALHQSHHLIELFAHQIGGIGTVPALQRPTVVVGRNGYHGDGLALVLNSQGADVAAGLGYRHGRGEHGE